VVDAFPLDAVERKLLFGARKGATQTVVTWFIAQPKDQGETPIGAGDSMVGGLVWALTKGIALKEALGWGVASEPRPPACPARRLVPLS